jgi:hypothetical protein
MPFPLKCTDVTPGGTPMEYLSYKTSRDIWQLLVLASVHCGTKHLGRSKCLARSSMHCPISLPWTMHQLSTTDIVAITTSQH